MKNVLQMTLITLALVPNALAQGGDQPKAAETTGTKAAEIKAETKKEEGPKATSGPEGSSLGLSILGNHEAPKALVLVPWKPSEPGKGPEISTKVDASRNPIDKEVLVRMLRYHEVAKTNAAPSDPAPAPRRK